MVTSLKELSPFETLFGMFVIVLGRCSSCLQVSLESSLRQLALFNKIALDS